jgi:hypothetical protein
LSKECSNCKYVDTLPGHEPCVDCGNIDNPTNWEAKTADMVNRPPHYTHGKYECIDVMVDTFGKEAVQHFCVLNAFKYVWRSEHKNGLEDIKKAWRYLDIYLQLEGKKDGE